jgi:opacity protein-like surface antigen
MTGWCFLAALLIGGAIAVPAASAQETPRAYVRAAIGYDRSRDARLVDRSCDPAPLLNLFGCQDGTDGAQIGAAGDFGGTATVDVAAGVRVLRSVRVELALSWLPGFAFTGNATFLGAGETQPVEADVKGTALMARTYLDVRPFVATGPFEPFVAVGIGGARLRASDVTFTFPELAVQPATTTIRGGTHWGFAWDAAAGAAVRVATRTLIEGAYRYSDLGRVETDAGPIDVVRGDRQRFIDDVAGTRARVRSHSAYIGLRQEF